jgi:hypothetical protein
VDQGGRGTIMPLIKEIEIALPFVAEMSEDWQRDVARFISSMVTSFDNERTMTMEQRRRLSDLDRVEIERRLGEEE